MAKKLHAVASDRRAVRKVVDAKPCSSFILVELLEPQEVLNTRFTVSKDTKIEAPQCFIVDIGPGFDSSKSGFKIGDRIILSGGFVPIPKAHENDRQRGIVELHSIKAVLIENDELQQTVSLVMPGD